jgi:radical SAM superfamily enzyme YgiQ (UPF0313 family)
MKVVLVYPNQTELDDLLDKYQFLPGYRYKPQIPLGMLYLCSNIAHEVIFIDNNIKKYSNQRLFEEIIAHNPNVVGFGGTMMEWIQCCKLSKMLQEVNIPTIYGGPNGTVNSEKHIQYYDYIIRGEGEITLNELLNALESQKHLRGIKGLWFKTNSSVIKNPDRALITELETLKYPARHLVKIDDYCRTPESFLGQGPCDIVVSSRGCPYRCRFCSSKYFWKQTYRVRKIAEVIKEISFMMENYGTKTIHFREDNFTVNRKRVFDFCDEFEKLGVHWLCQSRVDSVDEELVKRMKESGCMGICFGFESANDNTLKYLRKGITLKQSIKAIDICEKVGMNWAGGFMVGVLNETKEDMHNTLDFVRKIRKYAHSYLSPGAARFLGFPVSETYSEIRKKKLLEYDWQNGELLIPRTRYLTAKQVEDILAKDRYPDLSASIRLKLLVRSILKKVLPKTIFLKVRYLYRRIIYS